MKALRPALQEKLHGALRARVQQRGAAAMAVRTSSDIYGWAVGVGGEDELALPESQPLFLAHADLCIALRTQAGCDCFFSSYENNSTLFVEVIVFDDPQSYNPCQNDA